MGDCNVDNGSKKRVRDDSVEVNSDSPEMKRVNTNTHADPNPSQSNRVETESAGDERESEANSAEWTGVEPESDSNSPDARMIQEDLLDILDDTETVPGIQDLDSVIRSFEEEIRQASPSAAPQTVVELPSNSGDSPPDLGYLLEASDDELGLPPAVNSSEVQPQNEPSNPSQGNADVLVGMANMSGFEEDLPGYDTFGLGIDDRPIEGGNYAGNGTGDYVTVDGLFDYPEPSDFGWRPESLPAL